MDLSVSFQRDGTSLTSNVESWTLKKIRKQLQ
jgi:hypothetical protein